MPCVLLVKTKTNPQQSIRATGNSKTQGDNDTDHDKIGYVYDRLCTATETTTSYHEAHLQHHTFDGQCVARPSTPHPMLMVSMTPMPEDHAFLGHSMKAISKRSLWLE